MAYLSTRACSLITRDATCLSLDAGSLCAGTGLGGRTGRSLFEPFAQGSGTVSDPRAANTASGAVARTTTTARDSTGPAADDEAGPTAREPLSALANRWRQRRRTRRNRVDASVRPGAGRAASGTRDSVGGRLRAAARVADEAAGAPGMPPVASGIGSADSVRELLQLAGAAESNVLLHVPAQCLRAGRRGSATASRANELSSADHHDDALSQLDDQHEQAASSMARKGSGLGLALTATLM